LNEFTVPERAEQVRHASTFADETSIHLSTGLRLLRSPLRRAGLLESPVPLFGSSGHNIRFELANECSGSLDRLKIEQTLALAREAPDHLGGFRGDVEAHHEQVPLAEGSERRQTRF
jgi:hypothetical protein